MKQLHILKYFISLTVILFCATANAQNDSIASTANDSLKFPKKFGLRVGVDLSKIARTFLEDDYTGFEIQGDYRLKNNLYIAGEIGNEEETNITEYLDITTKGSYLKAGIDINLYNNWLDMDNMIYTGFRAGASSFSHTLNNYTIYNVEHYWDPQFSSTESREYNGLSAIWLELLVGLKAELFNNLFVGLNVQLKYMLTENEPDNFQSIYIPGFNKTYDETRIGVGYGYSISYRIPLYKKD